jgi:hypothetical protein
LHEAAQQSTLFSPFFHKHIIRLTIKNPVA